MLAEIRRLFYPHSKNNYKAGILQPQGLCVLIALFLLTQSFFRLSLGLSPGVLGFASDISPEEIVEWTNRKRTESGLNSVNLNEKLSEAARQKAADMFALNYWSHVSPRGVNPWSFIMNAGYSYLYAGENLARDFSNAQGVVEAWMNSPSHKDNILNKKYKNIGVAVVDGILQGQETTLVVQMFASPQEGPAAISKEAKTQSIFDLEKKEVLPEEATAEAIIETTPEREAREAAPGFVLTESKIEKKVIPLLSSFTLNKSLGLAFAGFLFVVLAIDGLVIYIKKKARISGHNFIHGTFVIILIIMILLSQQGMIL